MTVLRKTKGSGLSVKQELYRKRLLKLLHTLKKNHPFFCSEDDRRNWIEDRFGCRSFAMLTIDELEETADYMRGNIGAEPGKSSRATKKQIYSIKTMWKKNADNPDDKALSAWVCKILGIAPLRLEYINKRQASDLIVGLNRMFN